MTWFELQHAFQNPITMTLHPLSVTQMFLTNFAVNVPDHPDYTDYQSLKINEQTNEDADQRRYHSSDDREQVTTGLLQALTTSYYDCTMSTNYKELYATTKNEMTHTPQAN